MILCFFKKSGQQKTSSESKLRQNICFHTLITFTGVLNYVSFWFLGLKSMTCFFPLGSGVIGSGICIFSKSPITAALFHQWALNGYVHKVLWLWIYFCMEYKNSIYLTGSTWGLVWRKGNWYGSSFASGSNLQPLHYSCMKIIHTLWRLALGIF